MNEQPGFLRRNATRLAAVPAARFALDPAPLPHDARTMAPMGCLLGDWNEDGMTDLAVYYWGRSRRANES